MMTNQISRNQKLTEKNHLKNINSNKSPNTSHGNQHKQSDNAQHLKQSQLYLYKELTKHLCSDFQPSKYLNQLLSDGKLDEYPFTMLKILDTIPQSTIHHPEGCVWNHVCLVVDHAARVHQQSRDPLTFMWAALLHDIGKSKTTRERRGKITAYDHDTVGMHMAVEFLSQLTNDQTLIKHVGALVKYHMHPLYVLKSLPFGDIQGMKKETDIREIALLGFCDRMGRTGSNAKEESKKIKMFLEKCGIKNSSLHLSSHEQRVQHPSFLG